MPKPKQHQEKANSFRTFLNTIVASGPPEWVAIVAFYTAVHLVEKLRAYAGEHSTNHEERNAVVRSQHPSIHTAYHELFNQSVLARYHTVGKFTLSLAQVRGILVDKHLVQIEAYVAAETAKHTTPPRGASSGGTTGTAVSPP